MQLSATPDAVLRLARSEGAKIPPELRRVWIDRDEILADIDTRRLPIPMNALTATLKVVGFAADTLSVRLGVKGFGGGIVASAAAGQIRSAVEKDGTYARALRFDGTTVHVDLTQVLPGCRRGLVTDVRIHGGALQVKVREPLPTELERYVKPFV